MQVALNVKFYFVRVWSEQTEFFNNFRSQSLSSRCKTKKNWQLRKIDVATSLQAACFRQQSACNRLD